MARRGVARAGLAALLVAAAGCAVVVENVTYGRGHSPYPGYGVEYVEASPAPGALLREGDTVRLTIRVRYSLLNAKRGVLKLQFDDQSGNPLLDDRIVGQEIRRSQVTEAEVTQEIVVPSRTLDLVACVLVVPEGERDVLGGLRIRYPITSRR